MASAASAAAFTPCADAASAPALAGTLCATQAVPAGADEASGTASIFVREFPAQGARQGRVWLVAGGPGESGASLYPLVATLRAGFPGFDLLIPDHRGTGFSTRVCPDEESPTSPGGTALVGAEWGSCYGRLGAHPELAGEFSITAAARDLKRLVERERARDIDSGAAPGPTYLYGVSYGTQLVLRTLQLGALPVDGVLLDSLVPPQTAEAWDLSHRSFVVDAVGRAVLARCDADAACRARVGGSAEAAYRALLVRATRDKSLVADIPGGDLKAFFGSLLDDPATRARIPALAASLSAGRHDELAAVLDRVRADAAPFGAYAQSPLSIPLVGIISASENDLRPGLTAAQLRREDEALLFTSPLPALLVDNGSPTYPRDAFFGQLPARFPPLVVLQGTLDPKTPLEGARAQVLALRAKGAVRLVEAQDAPHFVLLHAPACFERAAHALLDGRSAGDDRCPAGADRAAR